jgi:hypothetical protein
MNVHYRSVRIVNIKGQTIPSTWSRPEQILTTTTYDMLSVQDHIVDIPLSRPRTILGVLGRSVGSFLALMFLVSLIPLIALAAIGGERLLDKLMLPIVIVLAPFVYVFLALPAARKVYIEKQMEILVRRERGVGDKYKILPAKLWPDFAAKLHAPFP